MRATARGAAVPSQQQGTGHQDQAGPTGCRGAHTVNSLPRRPVTLPAPCVQGTMPPDSIFCASSRSCHSPVLPQPCAAHASACSWQHAPAAAPQHELRQQHRHHRRRHVCTASRPSIPVQALAVQLPDGQYMQGLYELSHDVDDTGMPSLPVRHMEEELHVQVPVDLTASDSSSPQTHVPNASFQHHAIQPDAAVWLHQQGFDAGWPTQTCHHASPLHDARHPQLQQSCSSAGTSSEQLHVDTAQQQKASHLHAGIHARNRRRRMHESNGTGAQPEHVNMGHGADVNDSYMVVHGQHDSTHVAPMAHMSLDPEKHLTVQLQQCSSFQQVLEVLHEYASRYGRHDAWQLQQSSGDQPTAVLLQALNSRHLAVLWCTIGRVANDVYSGQASNIQRDALRSLVRKLEELSVRCMTDVCADGQCPWRIPDAVAAVWAMGHLKGHVPSRKWIHTWFQFTQPHLPTMWARHLAKALWGLAAAGEQPPSSWLGPAITRIIHVGTRSYSRLKLTVPGYASVLWAVSRLAVQAHTSALPGTIESLPSPLTSAQLCQYLQRAVRYVRCMQPKHISMMLWSLGHLAAAQHPAISCLSVTSNQQHQQGDATSHAAAAAEAEQLRCSTNHLWAAVSEVGAQRLGPQGTANVLWAAAQLGVRLHSPQSSTGPDPGLTARLAVQQLVQGSTMMLKSMSPQQLYNTAWALAKLQVAPSQAWVHSLFSASRPQLTKFDAQSLVGLLWVCCKLRVKPGPVWMSAAMRVVDALAHSDKLCATSLPLLLWCLAELGYQPGLSWTKAVTVRTWRLLPQMQPQGLAMCVHALAKLQLPAHPTWCKAFRMCLEQCVSATAAAAVQVPASQRPWPVQAGVSEAAQLGNTAEVLEIQRQVLAWRPLLPEELSASLQGMARLGIQPTPGLLAAAEQLLSSWLQPDCANRPRMGMRQLAGCLYGLVRLSHATASVSFLATCADACITMANQRAVEDSQEQNTCGLGYRSKLGCLAADVAQATWALAMLRHTPTQEQLHSLAAVVQRCMPYMEHAELAQCVWAVQRMGLTEPDASWVEAVLGASEQHLRQLLQHYRMPAPIPLVVPHTPCSSTDSMDSAVMLQPISNCSIDGAPLLSVATLLRAMAQWSCSLPDAVYGTWNSATTHVEPTACTGAQAGKPLRLQVRRSWLEAAMLVVEVEAQRLPCTAEGMLPSAAQLSASPMYGLEASAINRPSLLRPTLQLPAFEPSSSHATAEPNGTSSHTHASPGSLPQPANARHAVHAVHADRHALSPPPSRSACRPPPPPSPTPTPAVPLVATHDVSSVTAATLPGAAGAGWSEPAAVPYTLQQDRMKALAASEVNSGKKVARKRLWRNHRMHVLQHHKVVQASRRALQQLLASCSTSSRDDSQASADGSDCSTQPLLNGQDAQFIPW